MRMRRNQPRQPLDKGLPRTGGITAVQASHRQLETNLAPEAGQIGRPPQSAAVDRLARLATVWAARAALSRLGMDLAATGIRAGHLSDPAPRQEMQVVHPGLYSQPDHIAATCMRNDSLIHAFCGRADCLDNRLRYAARLKASSCQAARIWAGLRYPFFSMSHSAL